MKIAKKIPSVLDWGDVSLDRDVKYAYEKFFGKDLGEAEIRFEKQVLMAAEDLHFMPPIPFQYYMLAFCNYLSRHQVWESLDACDAASSFLGLVLNRVTDSFDDIAPILLEVMPVAEYVAANQKLFDADRDIYGDFEEMLWEIKAKICEAQRIW